MIEYAYFAKIWQNSSFLLFYSDYYALFLLFSHYFTVVIICLSVGYFGFSK